MRKLIIGEQDKCSKNLRIYLRWIVGEDLNDHRVELDAEHLRELHVLSDDGAQLCERWQKKENVAESAGDVELRRRLLSDVLEQSVLNSVSKLRNTAGCAWRETGCI